VVVVVVFVAVYRSICLPASLKTKQFCETSSTFELDNIRRAPCFSLSLATPATLLHRIALVVKNSCAWPRVWAWPQCPYYVPINSQLFPHHLLWPYYFRISSHYFPAISLCFPHQFPSIFPLFPLRFPYCCPIIFPIMFLLFPYYFPIVSQSFPLIFYSFNMCFPSGPY
jgi:hypothetical protein